MAAARCAGFDRHVDELSAARPRGIALSELQTAGKLHCAVAEHLRNRDVVQLERYQAQVDFNQPIRLGTPLPDGLPVNADDLTGR